MLLSELYQIKEEKEYIKECRDLISEIIALAPSRGGGGGGHYDKPVKPQDPTSHIRKAPRVMHPGMTGRLQSAMDHLKDAVHELDKETKSKGKFNPEIYKNILKTLRDIRDRVAAYKQSFKDA